MNRTFSTYSLKFDDKHRKYTMEILLSLWLSTFMDHNHPSPNRLPNPLPLNDKKLSFMHHGEGPTENLFRTGKPRATSGHLVSEKGGLCHLNPEIRRRFSSLTRFMPNRVKFSTFVNLVLNDMIDTHRHSGFVSHCASNSPYYKTFIKVTTKNKESSSEKKARNDGLRQSQAHVNHVLKGAETAFVLKNPEFNAGIIKQMIPCLIDNGCIDKIQIGTKKKSSKPI